MCWKIAIKCARIVFAEAGGDSLYWRGKSGQPRAWCSDIHRGQVTAGDSLVKTSGYAKGINLWREQQRTNKPNIDPKS